MKKKLIKNLQKRRESMYEFYYMGIGDRIKKKRLELNMTQEKLAKGICSNTYISKIENQKTKVKTAPLYLIMERIEMDGKKIGFPEELVDKLEKSINYFYYKNVDEYKKLVQEIEDYEFGVLLCIIRLGYYVLIEDFEKALPLYNETFRYLNTLENFGLSVFFIYAGYFNLEKNDLKNARMIVEVTYGVMQNDERIIALYSHLSYAVFGELEILGLSPISVSIAKDIYIKTMNFTRLNEIAFYDNLFKAYIGVADKVNIPRELIAKLTPRKGNKLLFSLANIVDNPIPYVDILHKDGDYYLEGLIYKAKYYLENKEMEAYKSTKKLINKLHYELGSSIDYIGLLKLYESNDELYTKEFLINYLLPYSIKKQNIQWIKLILDEIVAILKSKNRYKDALSYQQKKESIIKELQYYEK